MHALLLALIYRASGDASFADAGALVPSVNTFPGGNKMTGYDTAPPFPGPAAEPSKAVVPYTGGGGVQGPSTFNSAPNAPGQAAPNMNFPFSFPGQAEAPGYQPIHNNAFKGNPLEGLAGLAYAISNDPSIKEPLMRLEQNYGIIDVDEIGDRMNLPDPEHTMENIDDTVVLYYRIVDFVMNTFNKLKSLMRTVTTRINEYTKQIKELTAREASMNEKLRHAHSKKMRFEFGKQRDNIHNAIENLKRRMEKAVRWLAEVTERLAGRKNEPMDRNVPQATATA
ncbi:hypothetical protein PAPHI01_0085 [Pancytospora philotis]|nr:hypothetical protein PAPHI01_0085 [Pancytospora philotis]